MIFCVLSNCDTCKIPVRVRQVPIEGRGQRADIRGLGVGAEVRRQRAREGSGIRDQGSASSKQEAASSKQGSGIRNVGPIKTNPTAEGEVRNERKTVFKHRAQDARRKTPDAVTDPLPA